MPINQYLEHVLGSKIKIKVLRTLFRYPEKRFSARELAALSGVAHPPALRSLADLEEWNLIRKERHGPANVITLNSKSHLYDPLHSLFTIERETKEGLVRRMKALLPPAKMAVLFGSVQTGTESRESDIDILLVTDNKSGIENRLDDARLAITKEFGRRLSPFVLTMGEFKKAKTKPYAQELAKNYRVIAGKDLIKKWWNR